MGEKKRNETEIVMSNIQEQILAAIAKKTLELCMFSAFVASNSLSVTCPSMLSAYHSPSTSHRRVVHETVPIPAARAPPFKYVLSFLVSSCLVWSGLLSIRCALPYPPYPATFLSPTSISPPRVLLKR